MRLYDLVNFLDQELRLSDFPNDCSNNGLQVEASAIVRHAVFGVDGCGQLIQRAAEINADFIFVHHGISWGDFPKRLVGIEARRLGALFSNGLSLYAAHLPLDAHPVFGNNAILCEMLGIKDRVPFYEYKGNKIGFIGRLPQKTNVLSISRLFEQKLGANINIIGSGNASKVAVVSGGGGGSLREAAENGADLLLTGEINHTMYHEAIELGVNVIGIGHYASETTGPHAIMKLVSDEFSIKTTFIDIPTNL